ncbi:hypothetical protein BC830DRAFT_1076330 [Chytriomyces sp. MP71]|nr:hypothetical protein BC830DRAFT_1076330 [Chytriomyces sp. MP71]
MGGFWKPQWRRKPENLATVTRALHVRCSRRPVEWFILLDAEIIELIQYRRRVRKVRGLRKRMMGGLQGGFSSDDADVETRLRVKFENRFLVWRVHAECAWDSSLTVRDSQSQLFAMSDGKIWNESKGRKAQSSYIFCQVHGKVDDPRNAQLCAKVSPSPPNLPSHSFAFTKAILFILPPFI